MKYYFEGSQYWYVPNPPEELLLFPLYETEVEPLPNTTFQQFDGYQWIEKTPEEHASSVLQFLDYRLYAMDVYNRRIIAWIKDGVSIPQQEKDERETLIRIWRMFFQCFVPGFVDFEKDDILFSRTFSEEATQNYSEYQKEFLKEVNSIHLIYINSSPIQMPQFVKSTGVVTGLSVSVGDKITIIFN